ncbi:hypothetical protein NG895_25975 [Aeoliella sp. ICT_H6.2]|uniref:FlgN protein n=1 Tax=Aeoliella straminimaris TaxID=2954799 RepID=A0A9X2JIR0_9BACT|nr:hypothetical protein [Aeoliella straminimaris]MCO6047365.1 hypothetical protein [Aeoliella straminimaris]
MSSLATDNLAQLIRKKHQVLLQLRDIGLRQQQAVEAKATSTVLQLLGAKQHLIAALQMVERNLRPFQAEDPESRTWRNAEERAACARQQAECQQLLTEVMQLERDQEAKMVERRDQVAAQLRRANSAHQAASAYSQHRTPHSHAPISAPTAPPSHLDLSTGGR